MKNKKSKKKKPVSLQDPTKVYGKYKKHYLVDDLEPKHQEAVFLRIEGAEYQYIAKRLQYSYTYVRELFSNGEGGLCKPAYDQLRAEIDYENRKRFEKLQQEMEQAAPEAFTHLRLAAKKNWKAAVSVLDRAGFAPVQKVKAEVDTGDLDKVAEAIDKLGDYARQITTPSDEGTT